MSLPSTYSRRKRSASGLGAEVYQYDSIPSRVRIQVVHIFGAAFETPYDFRERENEIYAHLVSFMREELGVHRLNGANDKKREFLTWIEQEEDVDSLLDGIEHALIVIDNYVRQNQPLFTQNKDADAAITQLNARLAEAAIGYQYNGGKILRVDSQFVHAEVVVPALEVLRQAKFSAADGEYRAAHAAFRAGDYETCLVQCGKAFESVLKVVGGERKWAIEGTDTASRLLAAAFDAGFIPRPLQAEFTALRSLLESGIPTLRNKLSAHGAGEKPREVPEHFAALQLHQTAAAILFLVAQHGAVPIQ